MDDTRNTLFSLHNIESIHNSQEKDRLINNRYKIISPLGQGGMGCVYLVEDLLHDHLRLALKQINQKSFERGRSSGLFAFQNEFRTMCRLKHPNLVRVFDFGFDKERCSYFITMEYVEGYSMSILQKMKGDGAAVYFSDQAVTLLVDICRVLSFIHSRGIVHRDVNPGNIMLTSNNTIKLMDFGLADRGVKEHEYKGTLQYMAPEVLHGDVDFRADIFSLGITFWELLTGTPFYDIVDTQEIFTMLGNAELFSRHCEEKLEHANQKSFSNVLKKMIAYNPAQRFSNCMEIIGAINSVIRISYPYEIAETMEAYVLGAEFVGREEELYAVKQILARGKSSSFWVRGEAGVGKSRLFQEFRNWCQINNILFLEGACTESIHKLFGPIIPIISEILLNLPDRLVDNLGTELKKIVPNHPSLGHIKVSSCRDPGIEFSVIVKTITRCIVDFCRQHTGECIIHLSSVQWIDEGSISVLEALLDEMKIDEEKNTSLHIYLSSRMEGSERIAELWKRYDLESLDLCLFNEETVRKYIMAVFGNNTTGPHLLSATRLIHGTVGGNPVFLQELVKSMIASGSIVRNGVFWELAHSFDQSSIPKSLGELIEARLCQMRLGAHEYMALQVISLFDRPVTVPELAAIVAVPDDFIKRLEHIEIITVRQIDSISAYEFGQRLVQGIVQSQIKNREVLHHGIADTLEKLHSQEIDAYVEELAHHYRASGNREKSLYYLKRAFEISAQHYDNDKAIEYGRAALKLFTDAEDEERMALYFDTINVYWCCSKFDESIQISEEIIEVAKSTGNFNAIGRAYYNLGKISAELLHSTPKILGYLKQARDSFIQANDMVGVANTYMAMGYSLYAIDKQYNSAMDALKEGQEIALKTNSVRCLTNIMCGIAQVHEARGEFAQAIEIISDAITRIKKEPDPLPILIANCALFTGLRGHFQACMGNTLDAILDYETEIVTADTMGNLLFKAFGLYKKADALIALKQYYEAFQCCCNAAELLPQLRSHHEVCFAGNFIHARSEYAMGKIPEAIRRLRALMDSSSNLFEKAKINYELWCMTREDGYRTIALDQHISFANQTKNWRHLARLEDLQKNQPSDSLYSTYREIGPTPKTQTGNLPCGKAKDKCKEIDKCNSQDGQCDFANEGSKEKCKEDSSVSFKEEHIEEHVDGRENLLAAIDKNDYFKELLSIIHDLNSNLDLSVLLRNILDSCILFLQAERGAILLVDENGECVPRHARNNKMESIPLEGLVVPKTVIMKMMSEGKSVFVPNMMEDTTMEASQSILQMKLRTIMAAPLSRLESQEITGSESKPALLLGIIYLDSSKKTKSSLQESNVALLQMLADQASVALHNSILRKELEHTVDQKSEIARALAQELLERKAAEAMVQNLNASLERRVKEKTEELERAQKSILEKTYKAGMADIVAALLYSTVDMLNSTVTSAQYVLQILTNSKIPQLVKANELLKEKMPLLEPVLASDEKARSLLNYYQILGETINTEYQEIRTHMARVGELHEQIGNTIKSQESLITHQQRESISIMEMIEETLEFFNAIFLENHIRVQTRLEQAKDIPMPRVLGQRFKIKHLLTNIITNAVEAMMSVPLDCRSILITVGSSYENRVTVTITDTGIGIPKNMLSEIFVHGFTTKQNRHGFGLKLSMSNMTALGGTIEARSEGENKGASFILNFCTGQ